MIPLLIPITPGSRFSTDIHQDKNPAVSALIHANARLMTEIRSRVAREKRPATQQEQFLFDRAARTMVKLSGNYEALTAKWWREEFDKIEASGGYLSG